MNILYRVHTLRQELSKQGVSETSPYMTILDEAFEKLLEESLGELGENLSKNPTFLSDLAKIEQNCAKISENEEK